MPRNLSRDVLARALEKCREELPLPELMDELGYGDNTDERCLCPFHDDHNPSFSVYSDGDRWFWKCFAGCGQGDEVDFLMKAEGLTKSVAIRRYVELAKTVPSNAASTPATIKTQTNRPVIEVNDTVWRDRVAAMTEQDIQGLARLRGYSIPFCQKLVLEGLIGLDRGNLCLPIHGPDRQVVGLHCKLRGTPAWLVLGGCKMRPLVIGDPKRAEVIFVFESQWDAFAMMDRLGWHEGRMEGVTIVVTRGAANGRLVAGICSADLTLFAFKQNDPIKDGSSAAEKWLEDVVLFAGCTVYPVVTPLEFKDTNDWTQAGATEDQILNAIENSQRFIPRPAATGRSSERRLLKNVVPDNGTALEVLPPSPGSDAFSRSPKLAIEDETGMLIDAAAAAVRSSIMGILEDEDLWANEKKTQISNVVVDVLQQVGRFYFHLEIRDFKSSMFFDSRQKILHSICSDRFQAWLSDWVSINRADSLFNYIQRAVETASLMEPSSVGIVPEKYWAARDDVVYLSNGDGAIVKVTGAAVELVENGTDGILFSSGKTLERWELSDPVDPFEKCALFRNANFISPQTKDLLAVWMYSLPTNPKCKPPAAFVGLVGSGKTRLAKGIAELYGIPFALSKADEKKEGDFWPSVDQGGIFTLDNADAKITWLADAVASASTDGCSVRRRLYTDSETVRLRPHAAVIITSANPTFAADAGLADRLLIMRMARREGETNDAALSEEIAAHRDGCLSFIAKLLSKALADGGETPAHLNARHPDFAQFAVRLGRALGREAEVIAALKEAESDKAMFCLENDYVCSPLIALIRQETFFEGNAQLLVTRLQRIDPGLRLTPKQLSKRLQNLWPHIQSVFDARKEVAHGGALRYTIKVKGITPPSLPVSIKKSWTQSFDEDEEFEP